ncbi:MAG TPA: FAD-binding oxidoreductase [Candidatus Dormibacteraeota bacterium]|nr:FAD-binding oxidoreductase [Candidatus Dormibacteraeota bacterium]
MVVTDPAVEKPSSAEELARILSEAATARHAVVPVGGGRASGMGNPLERRDVELHTTRLDRVIEHSQADMVVSVEAGITLEALQAHLGKAGQFLPLDPFHSPGHTIGGLLATGWTGPLRLRFGSPRDFLIGIRVALPDGKLATGGGRVVKNVSGYDMMKLHYGALGSLGVIVAASFKVFPKPLHDVTVVSHRGWDGADEALATPLAPSAVEISSDGRVLARYFGSPAAVDRVVSNLEWDEEDSAIWDKDARSGPESWARIAAPRSELRGLIERIPSGDRWWASPGAGIAHWAAGGDAATVIGLRSRVEAAGGTLVMLAAPDDFMRQVGAWGTPPPTIDVMRRLKQAFDPDGILNPGRYLV